MNLSTLWTMMFARIKADTGTGGLYQDSAWSLVTGAYNTIAPVNAVYPYIVYTVAGNAQRDGFEFDMIDYALRFSVIHDLRTTAHNAMQRCEAIIDRLYGDAMQNAMGTYPTFGFHRWTPDAASNWTFTTVHRTNSAENHDEDHLMYIEEYSLSASSPWTTGS